MPVISEFLHFPRGHGYAMGFGSSVRTDRTKGDPMTTDREWRDVADELERLVEDYETARPEFREGTAGSLVDRVRMLIDRIREDFKGH